MNTVNKSRSISRTSLSNKSTRIEELTEIYIFKNNSILSVFSGKGESLSSVTSDQQLIPCKNARNKTSDTLIMRKDPIQEPVNPSKRAKEDNIPDVEKNSPRETTPLFWHKVDYKGENNEKTRGYEDSPSETDGF